MTWEALTAIATAFTGCVILITAVIGVYQLYQLRQQRRDSAAIELMRSLQDTMFAHTFRLVLALPEQSKAADVHAGGPELEEAALVLAFRFETLGQLVYRGTISFETMEELVGGAVVAIWSRLEDFTQQTREQKNWPAYCEWFQWLAEQFEKRHRLEKTPAHVRLREWNP